jgi:hypothetical protein
VSDSVRLPLSARFALAGFLAERGVQVLTVLTAGDQPLSTLLARQTDLPDQLAHLPDGHSIAWEALPAARHSKPCTPVLASGRVTADAGGLLVRCQDSATLSELARECGRDA